MSKNKNRNSGYKPVDCESLEKEVSVKTTTTTIVNEEVKKPITSYSPFRIVGTCRISKTGQSLAIKINNPCGKGEAQYYNISRRTLIALFEDDENKLSVGNVIQFNNEEKEEQSDIIVAS